MEEFKGKEKVEGRGYEFLNPTRTLDKRHKRQHHPNPSILSIHDPMHSGAMSALDEFLSSSEYKHKALKKEEGMLLFSFFFLLFLDK